MKLKLSVGDCDLVVKHDFNASTKKPMATAVSLRPLNNQFEDIFTGVSYPKHGDQFVYSEGRKYALKSLIRQLSERDVCLSYADKQLLWKTVCPKFYKSSSKKKCKNRKYKEFCKMCQEDEDFSENSSFVFNPFLFFLIILFFYFYYIVLQNLEFLLG